MVQHRRPWDKVGRWDCRGLPSRRKENEAVVVHFDDQAGGQEVVQRFIGFIIFDVRSASVVKDGLKRGDGLASSQFEFNAHDDRLASDGEERVVGVRVGHQIEEDVRRVRLFAHRFNGWLGGARRLFKQKDWQPKQKTVDSVLLAVMKYLVMDGDKEEKEGSASASAKKRQVEAQRPATRRSRKSS